MSEFENKARTHTFGGHALDRHVFDYEVDELGVAAGLSAGDGGGWGGDEMAVAQAYEDVGDEPGWQGGDEYDWQGGGAAGFEDDGTEGYEWDDSEPHPLDVSHPDFQENLAGLIDSQVAETLQQYLGDGGEAGEEEAAVAAAEQEINLLYDAAGVPAEAREMVGEAAAAIFESYADRVPADQHHLLAEVAVEMAAAGFTGSAQAAAELDGLAAHYGEFDRAQAFQLADETYRIMAAGQGHHPGFDPVEASRLALEGAAQAMTGKLQLRPPGGDEMSAAHAWGQVTLPPPSPAPPPPRVVEGDELAIAHRYLRTPL